ncbi:MAG: type II toxin-antitoxin system HicA family toxin [archaeon]|jgi:predicted RNA binding protein YcfA (HicA-like mRNA interferase family)
MKLPLISAKDLIKFLSKKGFVISRQKGSHIIMKKNTNASVLVTVIPLHDKLDTGTLLAIMKQTEVTREEIYGEFY